MPPCGAMRARIILRMSKPHYGGNLVDGAQMLSLFGDVATELCIRADGDEGLFRAYDSGTFLGVAAMVTGSSMAPVALRCACVVCKSTIHAMIIPVKNFIVMFFKLAKIKVMERLLMQAS